MMSRQQYYQQLGMAKTQLIKDGKLTEADYRGMLAMHGSEYHNDRFSASSLTGASLKSVLKQLEGLGWVNSHIHQTRHLKVVNTPLQKKVWALWFALKKAGQISSTKVDALNVWLQRWSNGRVVSIGQLAFLPIEAAKVVEYLKKWLARVEKA